MVLPGDNADHGLPAQYALASTALKMLSTPIHAIPGDHDMEQGGLDAFYAADFTEPLPKALTVRGIHCLFLDISGPGTGGPDFRVGTDQASWVELELRKAKEREETSVLFMHSYPDDLKGDGETEAFNRLIATHDVAFVDMGHTHYNELANDGRTIFAATRSTGQIEEGPAGYSIVTLDGGVVSWRFKPLDDAFPFVVMPTQIRPSMVRARCMRWCSAIGSSKLSHAKPRRRMDCYDPFV
ncbi:MAG: metallophosphoesterase family protein [Methylocella sp.]